MSKIPIEIGIPAHNEQENIVQLLDSILDQKQEGFYISRIIIVSDGSTDETVGRALSVKSKLTEVEVVDEKERRGKAARVAQLFRSAKTDIMVLFDADVLMANKQTISRLITPILHGEAALTSGRPKKVNTSSRFDQIMDVSIYLQDYIKSHFRNGVNLYACHGRIVAMHRSTFSRLAPFDSWTGDDTYLYLFNKKVGGRFVYVDNATVYFKMPQSEADFIKQQSRFSDGQQQLAETLGAKTRSEYHIPIRLVASAALLALFKHRSRFILYAVLRTRGKAAYKPTRPAWAKSDTTKTLLRKDININRVEDENT